MPTARQTSVAYTPYCCIDRREFHRGVKRTQRASCSMSELLGRGALRLSVGKCRVIFLRIECFAVRVIYSRAHRFVVRTDSSSYKYYISLSFRNGASFILFPICAIPRVYKV